MGFKSKMGWLGTTTRTLRPIVETTDLPRLLEAVDAVVEGLPVGNQLPQATTDVEASLIDEMDSRHPLRLLIRIQAILDIGLSGNDITVV
jgi:hypothetical protein